METRLKPRVAVAHVAPVFLDAAKSLAKAESVIAEAARNSARLIAFPEGFVPGFPVWAAVAPPYRTHGFFDTLAANALRVPGPETARLQDAARRHRMFVSMGMTEGTAASVGCLWNTNLLIGDDGALLVHHRKIVPTYFEKLVWAAGDGAGLTVADTAIGRIGMLICGENTNPLARYAMIAQGEQIHISSYPPVWPTREPGADKAYNLANAIRIRAGAHAFEAKAFNLVAAAPLDETLLDAIAILGTDARRIVENSPQGVSMVIDPSGETIGDTLSREEGILYRDLDLADCVEPKQFHDVSGGYNRFDIFSFAVDRRRLVPARWIDDDRPAESAESQEETRLPDRHTGAAKDDGQS